MISPGEILLLDIPLVDPPHDKFTLVLSVSPKAYFVFINSRISDFIRGKPDLLQAQVTIDAGSHRFLEYDSYLNCSEVFYQGEPEMERIRVQLRNDPSRHKGMCSTEVLNKVLAALNEAPTVSGRIRKAAQESLSPLLKR